MSTNNISIKNKRSPQCGFTIVETLVAVSILIVVIVGVTGALQTAISSYIFSKNQIIAFYLAQEGFEQIRNRKDENVLNGRHWLHGFAQNPGDPCYFNSYCTVDIFSDPNNFIECAGPGSCPLIRQNNTDGRYGYNNSWEPTEFRREIVLSQISQDEISVTVTIDWSKGLINRQFRARENILNWIQ